MDGSATQALRGWTRWLDPGATPTLLVEWGTLGTVPTPGALYHFVRPWL